MSGAGLTFGSLFAGIGGFDLGFTRAGFRCTWQVEIDDRARAVLDARFPNTTKYKDVRDVGKHNLEAVDIITGGFPCQDLSVAGKRAGLDGERSGLWFEFHRVLEEVRPAWCVIENVPGLLSSSGGRDFAVILRGLAELGYGVAWRVLDSQFFGVPQRRRRVFIVGHLGDGRAAEVLFEREGGTGNTAEGREAGQRVAAAITGKPYADNEAQESRLIANAFNGYTGGADDNDAQANHIVYSVNTVDDGRKDRPNGGMYVREVDKALTPASKGQNLIAFSAGQSADAGSVGASDKVSPTLKGAPSGTNQVPAVAWHNSRRDGVRMQDNIAPTVEKFWGTGGNNVPFVGVRRITPRECERLQGFPDDWTLVEGTSDSARYRQLGNAVTVNVIEWLALRVLEQQA